MHITYYCPKCRNLISIEFNEDIELNHRNFKDIEIEDYDCPNCGYPPLINVSIDIN